MKPKEKKPMTIAAGFLCREGIILCADTEVTGWSQKFHETKLGHFPCPGGDVAFAVAGNTHFGWTAIEKLKRRLQAATPEETMDVIERTLDREYRRNVLSNPGLPSDSSLHYHLLISVWAPIAGAKLYVTSQTALRPVNSFECIGIGNELAGYLIRPTFNCSMPIREVLSLASYALKGAKESVSGCGGMSIYLIILNDGRFGTLTSVHDGPTKNIEDYSKAYDFMTRELLVCISNPDASDSDIEQYLTNVFCKRIMERRQGWKRDYETGLERFKAVNPSLSDARARRLFADIQIGVVPDDLGASEQ